MVRIEVTSITHSHQGNDTAPPSELPKHCAQRDDHVLFPRHQTLLSR